MLEETAYTDTIRKRPYRYKLIIICVVGIVGVVGAATDWWIFLRQAPAVVNPFSNGVLAAMQFPLYYPTKLPTGYRIDAKSTNTPQAGVVVFNLVGPKGQKLYISEEARPTEFSIGNFYLKLSDLKEVPVSDGAIAAGRLGSGQTEIVSRANNKTWILGDTNAEIPFDELIAMMRSLQVGY